MFCGKAPVVRQILALCSFLFGIVVLSIGVITFTCWREQKEYPSSNMTLFLNLPNGKVSSNIDYDTLINNIIIEIINSKIIRSASGLLVFGGFIQLLCILLVVGKSQWLLWAILHILIGILSFIAFILPFFLQKPYLLDQKYVRADYANYFHSFSRYYEPSLLTPLEKYRAKVKFNIAVSFLTISLANTLISIKFGAIMFSLRNIRDHGPN